MHVINTDHRLSYLRDVESAITVGIKGLFARNQEQSWFDGLFIAEYGEVLYGALLTASQAYCVGTVADLNEYRAGEGLPTLDKISAYRKYSVTRGGHSAIEFVNAAANCFKHRDEWKGWPDNPTTKTLAAYSIIEDSEFPLSDVHSVIHRELNFDNLCDLVSDWREGLLNQAKSERDRSLERNSRSGGN